MEEGMTLEQFREAKKSGVDLYASEQQEVQVDAAPIEQEPDVELQQFEEQDEPQDDAQDTNEPEAEADPIPQEQQSAWKKRAERERKKGAEEAEARLKAEYEAKINPLQKFFDQLGIDPETALKTMEQNKIKQEAEQLAYQNGWDEQQTEWYVKQQQQDKEMRELRVSVQINDLSDKSDYPGIKKMQSQIVEFVGRNPNMTVEQAYWAVGGQPLAQQLRREAEQREIAKRQQTKRTVVTDAPAQMTGPAPLPPEAVKFMRQNNMSEAQVRMLMSDKAPNNLEEYRKMTKGRK